MIHAILTKEWLELRRERSLIWTMAVSPLLLSLMPALIMWTIREVPDEDSAELGMALADPMLAGMSAVELGQAVVGKQFGLMLLLVPVILSGVIAAYSIVGEKNSRTLEPLLATPLPTWKLLLAKCLTALIPAVLATWLGALLFAVGVGRVAVSPRVLAAVISPAWALMMLLNGPLLGLIAIALSVAISSRVNDPRTAQQLSAVLVVPLLAAIFGQLFGVVVLSMPLVLGVGLVLALLVALALWLAVRLFQRETILTRWR
jgi:ABC-2 type transport system permease protein